MPSPQVWLNARERLQAANLGVPLAYPNEAYADPADSDDPLFVVVAMEGGTTRPLDVGLGGVWEETGALWCHIMQPTGTGIDAGEELRQRIKNTFRDLPPDPVMWGDSDEPLGEPSDDGGYFVLSLRISYRYQNRPS